MAAILRTDDSRLNILDSMITFANAITPGEVSFTLLDWFDALTALNHTNRFGSKKIHVKAGNASDHPQCLGAVGPSV